MKLRLYWLGPATEPGLWAVDSGPGTKVLRIDAWWTTGEISCAENLASTLRPRGWLELGAHTSLSFWWAGQQYRSLDPHDLLALIEHHGAVIPG